MTSRARALITIVALAALAVSGCSQQAPLAEGDASESADYSAAHSVPNTSPMYPDYGDPHIDVLHYEMDLGYEPEAATLSGTVTLTTRAVEDNDVIHLDFSDQMTVETITVDDSDSDFTHQGYDLDINEAVSADQEIKVAVTYSGTPEKMPAPAQRPDMAGGIGATTGPNGALWTFQEPFGAMTWYPANDVPWDEAFYDFKVSVPDGYAAVASGTFVSDDDNTYVWSSSDPVATYLVTLAVDRYTMSETKGPNGLPITTWTTSGSDMDSVFSETAAVLEWLEERYGPYPFESAGVVEVGGDSAMETQQMVTFSSERIFDETQRISTTGVLVHEMAHQWFGDAVTPDDWDGLWLNEGAATYTEQMWLLENDDTDMTEAQLVAQWEKDDADLRRQFGPPGDPNPQAFASSNSYVCPALMLYNLRDEIGGAEAVDEFLAAWVAEYHNETVDRETFIEFANAHTGKDLTQFFNEWLDSPTTPK
ncbi:MAG TPA: M1 family metallopeptidase [Candidatus Stackebrandtia faecavium]|nr:M1 family metallopeptidase [Candidatus Stackebrandtia faecavium]